MTILRQFPHRLKSNKSSTRPRNIVCLALSTTRKPGPRDTSVHNLHVGAALHLHRDVRYPDREPEVYEFDSVGEWWLWLYSHTRARERTMIVSSSMLANFTILAGWDYLPCAGWDPRTILSSEQLCWLEFTRDTKSLRFLDIINLLRDYRCNEREPLARATRLYETMRHYLDFLDCHDCGSFAISAAGQAFAAYRHVHMEHPIYIHADESVTQLERASYYGGRNEAYRLGVQESGVYTLLDVNSMYGAVMHDCTYPVKLVDSVWWPELRRVERYIQNHIIVVDCILRCEQPRYPCRVGALVVYPVGRFRAVLAGEEAHMAISSGHVERVIRCAWYEQAPIFRSFVDHYYNWRLAYASNGDYDDMQFCKVLINSLYGKFGQKSTRWETVSECDRDLLEYRVCYNADGTTTNERSLLGITQELQEGGNSINALPAIAACVTSAARVRLQALMCTAGLSNVVYCDTDSIITSAAGYGALAPHIDNTQLGALRVQEQSSECVIYGLKDYSIGSTRRCKGIPRSASAGRMETWEWESGKGLAQMLHEGNLHEYRTRHVRKGTFRGYKKGWLHEDRTISPFRLPFDRLNVPPQFPPPWPEWLVAAD